MKLDEQRIIAAAVDVLGERGLEGFNLRALAERLTVQAPALYWHVGGGKAELFGRMAGAIYREAFAAAPVDVGWRDWLLGYGRALRRALLARRDSARLCAMAGPAVADARRAAERLAAPLVAAGLSPATALSYQASVISLTLGWAIYEQSDALHDYLAAMIGFDDSFETGLTALVGGFPEPDGTDRSEPETDRTLPTECRTG